MVLVCCDYRASMDLSPSLSWLTFYPSHYVAWQMPSSDTNKMKRTKSLPWTVASYYCHCSSSCLWWISRVAGPYQLLLPCLIHISTRLSSFLPFLPSPSVKHPLKPSMTFSQQIHCLLSLHPNSHQAAFDPVGHMICVYYTEALQSGRLRLNPCCMMFSFALLCFAFVSWMAVGQLFCLLDFYLLLQNIGTITLLTSQKREWNGARKHLTQCLPG